MKIWLAVLLSVLSAGSVAQDGGQGEDATAIDCAAAATTLEINGCLAARDERSRVRQERYLQAATDRYSDEPAVQLGIEASQKAFEAYRDIECATVYEDWKDGTIGNAMARGCRIRLNDTRAHTIWENWLHYADSTPPILPEPGPIE